MRENGPSAQCVADRSFIGIALVPEWFSKYLRARMASRGDDRKNEVMRANLTTSPLYLGQFDETTHRPARQSGRITRHV